MTIELRVILPPNLDKIFEHFQSKQVNQAVKASINAAFDQLKEELVASLDEQKKPGGNAWQNLSQAQAKYKQEGIKPGKGIMQFDGGLKKEILNSRLDWSSPGGGNFVGDSDSDTGNTHFVVPVVLSKAKAAKPKEIPVLLIVNQVLGQNQGQGQGQKDVLKKAFAAFDGQIKTVTNKG